MKSKKLKYILIVLAVFSSATVCMLGWFAYRAKVFYAEEAAVKQLLASGANVEQEPAKSLLGIPLSDRASAVTYCGCHVDSTPLRQIRKLCSLQFINTTIPEHVIHDLHSVEELQYLSMEGCTHGTSWKEMENLRGLIFLTVSKMPVKAEDLKSLAMLDHLVMLSLFKTGLTDDVLEGIPLLPSLNEMNISCNPITGKAFVQLAKLSRLKILRIVQCPIEWQMIQPLAYAPHLDAIDLGGEQCDDMVIQAVSKLNRIKFLTLCGPQVTDKGTTHLCQMQQLLSLSLVNTSVTPEGNEKLLTAMPTLRVTIQNDNDGGVEHRVLATDHTDNNSVQPSNKSPQ